jgi:hypothetical protein
MKFKPFREGMTSDLANGLSLVFDTGRKLLASYFWLLASSSVDGL